MNAVADEFPLLGGNKIIPHVTGNELYPRMLQAIDNAAHHIHLQSFIIRNDRIGREFMEHLAAKAKSGVQVRLLYDQFGSMQAILTGLFRRYRNVPNMQISGWTQVNPLKRRFQLNLRNHRKALIIDGVHAFMGGINIHRENVTSGNRSAIRDYHFEMTGSIVQEIQYSFLKDWYFMTDENPEIILQPVYFPATDATGDATASIVCSGPTYELQPITDLFFMAITNARHQLLIVTPYFVPSQDILRALRSAAIRGVDVRIILPHKNNHVYAGWASRALYEELLQSGVRIFERKEPFIHAKALLSDDSFAIVGSANWDIRSLKLNYETNMTVTDNNFANELKRIILEDESQSTEIDLSEWHNRANWRRLVENACSLLTPAL
jgi:cardiolipin synthase